MSESPLGIAAPARINGEFSPSSPILRKENLQDNEGRNRDVYTFRTKSGKAVQALFYSAQEIPPISPGMKDKKVFVYGEKPKETTDKQWFDTQADIRQASLNKESLTRDTYWWDISEAIKQENALFVVEATPKNILDLAFTMGVESPALRNLRAQFSRGQVTDEVLDFTDTIIAGKVVNASGEIRTDKNFEGEALMVQALSGDVAALAELQKRQQVLSEIDKQQDAERIKQLQDQIPEMKARLAQMGEPEMEVKDLALVRLARTEPEKESGKLVLRSAYDSDPSTLRRTVHFAVNRTVTGHGGSNDWTACQIVTISPLGEAIELNGKPRSMNVSDTYFDLSPGKALKMPEKTVVIKPGKLGEGELYRKESRGNIIYKTADFSPPEVQSIQDQISQDSPGKFNTDGQKMTNDTLYGIKRVATQYWLEKLQIKGTFDPLSAEYGVLEASLDRDILTLEAILNQTINYNGNIFTSLQDRSLAEILQEFRGNCEGKVDGTLALGVQAFLRQTIESKLASEVRDLAIRKVLDESGLKWLEATTMGDMGNTLDGLKFDLLTAQLGIQQMSHYGDVLHEFETRFRREDDDGKLFLDRSPENREIGLTTQNIQAMPAAARRMIYQLGLL